MPEGQHVGLGDQRQPFALGVVALLCVFKGPADTALAAFSRVHGCLRGDFVRRVLLQEPAHAAVQVFGVLADDDEVDVFRAFARQRRLDTRVQLDRAEVDVLIQLESQFQQQAFLQDARRDIGMPDGAQVDRVELLQFVDGACRQGLLGAEIAFSAEVVMLQLERKAFLLGDCRKHFECFRGYFRACPVTTNDCNLHSSSLLPVTNRLSRLARSSQQKSPEAVRIGCDRRSRSSVPKHPLGRRKGGDCNTRLAGVQAAAGPSQRYGFQNRPVGWATEACGTGGSSRGGAWLDASSASASASDSASDSAVARPESCRSPFVEPVFVAGAHDSEVAGGFGDAGDG